MTIFDPGTRIYYGVIVMTSTSSTVGACFRRMENEDSFVEFPHHPKVIHMRLGDFVLYSKLVCFFLGLVKILLDFRLQLDFV